MSSNLSRAERLQIMLTLDELRALDDWRFSRRMPSRAAAIRELLRRGLSADGFDFATERQQSTAFGVIPDDVEDTRKVQDGAGAKKK
jgi:hypothetical protein